MKIISFVLPLLLISGYVESRGGCYGDCQQDLGYLSQTFGIEKSATTGLIIFSVISVSLSFAHFGSSNDK